MIQMNFPNKRRLTDLDNEFMVARGKGEEKATAPHSSTFAWRIPGMGEPGGLPSMGSHRVGHDCSNLAAVAAAGGRVRGRGS